MPLVQYFLEGFYWSINTRLADPAFDIRQYFEAFVASHFRGIFGAFRRSDFLQLCRYMLAKIYSAAVYGVDAYEVEIEVNGAGGDPVIVIVGLPDAAVKESRDRVTTAIIEQRLLLAARTDHDQSRAGRH